MLNLPPNASGEPLKWFARLMQNQPFFAAGVYTEDEQSVMYAMAYQLFVDGRLDDAAAVFQALCGQRNPKPKYFHAMAACEQMRGNYQIAGISYGLAFGADQNDLKALFHMGECLLACNKLHRAESVLNDFMKRSAGKAEMYALRERASRLLEERIAPTTTGV
ncbi:hypothetical protein [Noviherbaspirillum galbum]|uniref:CesD/SycD/LcrH family type III secretion system chaperone n=1 Tax=Noviherbaspirillum galbum TaxID=2709383 RepID=A0A6B3SZK9_9BURK|nr:hypothetical protein [Noviherbaspirillum galbum]NEX64209.1 hypothetical protein [Noviherbaspirillum galbum]